MNTLHKIVQKTLIATFVLCFSIVTLYVPHLFNDVPEAEANPAGATEPTQILNNVQLFAVNGFTSITAAATPISAAMNTSQFFLDNVLDGIAWSLAKNIVSQMTASIVNWVNSGFKGSPAFVQDLGGFLEKAADQAVGAYLEELGGPFSFVCSPFQLDVRLAVAITFDKVRAGEAASTCSLTGALANIDKFIDQTQNFTDAGGWDNWFSVTANPRTYTPLGSTFAATEEAQSRLVYNKGKALKELDFGSGFMASKVCQQTSSYASGSSSASQKCTVSTPGKVIADTLNKQLGAGTDSLIQADEINEIIAAVFGQLASKAITGAAGLLGLSGGTGHTYSGTPFTQQIAGAGLTQNPERLLNLMQESRQNEQDLLNHTVFYEPQLQTFVSSPNASLARRADAASALQTIQNITPSISNNLSILTDLINRFQATQYSPPFTGTLTVNPDELSAITQEFNDLNRLHSRVVVDGYEQAWRRILQ